MRVIPENERSLLEAAVDIAYNLGAAHRKLAEHDSRENVSRIIDAARKFEDDFAEVEWGVDAEYIDEIDRYSQSLIDRGSWPL